MSDAALQYAEVLLKAAIHENAFTTVTDEMNTLAHGFNRCARVFSSPAFPVREQLSTVDAVMADGFHPLTKRFIFLLIEMRRLGEIEKIAETYDEIARREAGQVDLYMKVYEEPAPENLNELIDAVCEKGLFDPGFRENINVRFTVDKNIMGGFVAECEGKSWDCSLMSRFVELSKILRKV
jgi:F0F1-type ATP synthase delta subunit